MFFYYFYKFSKYMHNIIYDFLTNIKNKIQTILYSPLVQDNNIYVSYIFNNKQYVLFYKTNHIERNNLMNINVNNVKDVYIYNTQTYVFFNITKIFNELAGPNKDFHNNVLTLKDIIPLSCFYNHKNKEELKLTIINNQGEFHEFGLHDIILIK